MVAHAEAENGIAVLRIMVGYPLDLPLKLDHEDGRDYYIIFFFSQPPLLFYVPYLAVDDGEPRLDIEKLVLRHYKRVLHEGHHIRRLTRFEGAAP